MYQFLGFIVESLYLKYLKLRYKILKFVTDSKPNLRPLIGLSVLLYSFMEDNDVTNKKFRTGF